LTKRVALAAAVALAMSVPLAMSAPLAAQAEVRPSPIPLTFPTPRPTFSTGPDVSSAQRAFQQAQQVLAAEKAKLDSAKASAIAALQAYQDARRASVEAAAAAAAAAARAETAKAATAAAQAELQGYAGSLYRVGSVDPRLLVLTASLTSDEPQQFFNGIDMARQIGVRRGRIINTLTVAQAEEAAADAAAHDTAERQRAATARASRADTAARAAVADYTKQVARRQADLAKKTGVLSDAKTRQRALARAEAIARARGWTPAPPCAGQDVSRFANGLIPLDALCPLLFTTNHRLRADAAYNFNAMATAYAEYFGLPLCVTDSYRSYGAQVAVAAEKPTLAAEPGHSNHGWGLATDLCDGIQSFDTPTHQWMVDNAPTYGWFHPDWAEPTGSKPEPWHWEFAG
jgi:hypothetical protein